MRKWIWQLHTFFYMVSCEINKNNVKVFDHIVMLFSLLRFFCTVLAKVAHIFLPERATLNQDIPQNRLEDVTFPEMAYIKGEIFYDGIRL